MTREQREAELPLLPVANATLDDRAGNATPVDIGLPPLSTTIAKAAAASIMPPSLKSVSGKVPKAAVGSSCAIAVFQAR